MYREHPPVPGLGIACVWTRTTPYDAAEQEQLVVPDGCMDIIWSADRIQVAGPDTRGRHAKVKAGARLAALRFRPGAAPHVLGLPAEELRDLTVDLDDLWGAEACRIADEAAGGDPAVALQRAVAGRLRRAGPPDPVTAAIAEALGGHDGVTAVAGRLGMGDRQLRRRCLALFGYGPKTLQRVLRFQRALAMARAGVPFAEIAFSAGYADQSHLSHEVRGLAGTTLGELR